MVLYTPLSHEEIFPPEEDEIQTIEYQGRTMHVRRNDDGEYQLVRLISTNPADYLNNTFQPGSIINIYS